ncbi:hypothetical protein PG995_008806 [Apiospora arundinis]|uniref:Rhodopsin domain-containing protein n=1 Tax=Apiospora arundinis TaxID=335852 RepID=A0ABR2JMB6_9PEZI
MVIAPEHVMGVEWTMVSLAYIFVSLRIAVRIHWKQKHLIISDIWLVLAALCVLGLAICDTITYKMGRMADPTNKANVQLRKIWFATNYLFDAGLYLPKLSMVAIYHHLIPRHFHMLRHALYFVGFFVGCSFLITFFSDTFWCGPHPSVQWWPGPHSCSTFESKTLMKLNWSLCFTCEALLFALPFPLLSSLTSLSGREKTGLVGIFTLGAVTLGVSSGRFATMMIKGNDISIYVWSTTEFSVSIMIVASTALRPLIRKAWNATTFTSKHSGSGSGRRGPTGKFFKGGSGATDNSTWELKPSQSHQSHSFSQHKTRTQSTRTRIAAAAATSAETQHTQQQQQQHHHYQHQPKLQQQQQQPSHWLPEQNAMVMSPAPEEERNENNNDYFGDAGIPLSPMAPHSQHVILKTERFSISSSSAGEPQNQPPVSPAGMIDLEANGGGGGIWDGRSRLLI